MDQRVEVVDSQSIQLSHGRVLYLTEPECNLQQEDELYTLCRDTRCVTTVARNGASTPSGLDNDTVCTTVVHAAHAHYKLDVLLSE